VHPKDTSEKRLWQEILKNANKSLQDDEILVVDVGVKLKLLQEFEIECYVVRLATNLTARRNFLPEHTKGRKPTYGALVRPLAHKHKQRILEATAPDETYAWSENGVELRAEIWRDLVLPGNSPSQTNNTFDVYAIYDPRFEVPWCWQYRSNSSLKACTAFTKTAGWSSKPLTAPSKWSAPTANLFTPRRVFNVSPNWRFWQAQS
jgi:hypothetical protein